MSVPSLVELALRSIGTTPLALEGWRAPEAEFFERCAPNVPAAQDGENIWHDAWVDVRASAVAAARRGEPRAQICAFLAGMGALADGSLPDHFFEDFRVDCLSLNGSRIGAPTLARLAAAQTRQRDSRPTLDSARPTLMALDLGSCLLVDDAALLLIARACGGALRRLGLRDCRKITDVSMSTVRDEIPGLVDLDVGGSFNVTIVAVRRRFLLRQADGDDAAARAAASNAVTRKRSRTQAVEPEPAAAVVANDKMLAVGASGLAADDAFVEALAARAPRLRRLGLGFGAFSALALPRAIPRWPRLVDVRVQWSLNFHDTALEALIEFCPSLRALDVVGTPVSADALGRLVSLRGPRLGDDPESLADSRRLEWVNCRYTTGPKVALDALVALYKHVPNIEVLQK